MNTFKHTALVVTAIAISLSGAGLASAATVAKTAPVRQAISDQASAGNLSSYLTAKGATAGAANAR